MSMKIERIVAESPHGEVWVCASLELATNSNLMNSGFMILKNSDFVRSWLLPLWWTMDSRVDFNDQEIFDRMYMKYKTSKQLEKRVVVLEPDALNSDPPAGMKQKPQNQVLHLMGDHLPIRRKAFSSAFLEICRAVSYDDEDEDKDENVDEEDDYDSKEKSVTLKQQLGLDQKTLLAITLIEYQKEMENSVRNFRYKLESPISATNTGYNNFNEISTTNSALRRYSEGLDPLEKAWSKKEIVALQNGYWTSLDDHLVENQGAILDLYPEAMEALDSSSSKTHSNKKKKSTLIGAHPRSTEELGKIGFDLFMRNLRAYEKIRQGSIDKHEKAMLIFNALDAGSAVVKRRTLKYLSNTPTQQQQESKANDPEMREIMTESMEILASLLELADELLTLEPKEKRSYIYHIRSDLYADLGYVQKVMGEDDSSVENIRQALTEKEHEAEYAGEHCLAKTLMMLADRLCQLKRFHESLPYFDRAIRVQEAHLGPLHIGLGRFTSIAGQAYASTGQYKKAMKLIKRAIHIFENNPNEAMEFENDLPRARWLYKYCAEKLEASGGIANDDDDDDDDDTDDNKVGKNSKSKKSKSSKSSKSSKAKSRKDEL